VSSSQQAAFRRFIVGLTATVLICVALVALFNWWVNPYRLFQSSPPSGLTDIKIRPESNIATIKLLNAIDQRPKVVIFGNSRADVGLDPTHPALVRLGKPVYNLAVPGQGILGVLANFRTMLRETDVQTAIIGVDFIDFVVDAQPVAALAKGDLIETTRLGLLEQFRALFTITGLQDSVRTLLSARETLPATLRNDGFNPMLDYQDMAARSGYRAMFTQRFQETEKRLLQARLGLTPKDATDSAEMAALREIFELAAENDVRLIIFTYPYHADYLMLYRKLGLQDPLEAWKRSLVVAAADAARAHPGKQRPVVSDFATFSRYATLPVPDTAKDEAARWYWEAGHFKKELGDVMLATMLAPPGSSVNDDSFGSLLQPDNIDAWLSQQRDLASRHTATVEASDDSRYLCCRSDNRTATAHP
jgi:hypothetical protein